MPSYADDSAGSRPASVSVLMSPPAQNDFPTAFSTSAPTSDRASTSSSVAMNSAAIPGVSALRRSGAFSVTTATPSSTSSSTSPEPATSTPLRRRRRGTPRRAPQASDHAPTIDRPTGRMRLHPLFAARALLALGRHASVGLDWESLHVAGDFGQGRGTEVDSCNVRQPHEVKQYVRQLVAQPILQAVVRRLRTFSGKPLHELSYFAHLTHQREGQRLEVVEASPVPLLGELTHACRQVPEVRHA